MENILGNEYGWPLLFDIADEHQLKRLEVNMTNVARLVLQMDLLLFDTKFDSILVQ